MPDGLGRWAGQNKLTALCCVELINDLTPGGGWWVGGGGDVGRNARPTWERL